MSLDIVKLLVYFFSVMFCMYGLSCFNYEKFVRKGQLNAFYALYVAVSLGLGYLVAQFLLTFVSISLI